ncbi:MAG: hypothetical protein VX466_09230 [Myxococcota bacterium]|nr:hypothetical protein [Myxococcota bacterium]MEE2673966.1 hypothetical protein [Myxococcota bacterium]
MIARRKRRLAAALLIVFTTWPLVHYQLVRVYRLDPWKFGGWAMYTVVNFLPRVEVFAMRGGERQQLGLGSHDLPASRAASEQLVFDAKFYGELADPEPLARIAASEVGGDVAIEVVITRFFVDRSSARVSATRRSFFYEPPR